MAFAFLTRVAVGGGAGPAMPAAFAFLTRVFPLAGGPSLEPSARSTSIILASGGMLLSTSCRAAMASAIGTCNILLCQYFTNSGRA